MGYMWVETTFDMGRNDLGRTSNRNDLGRTQLTASAECKPVFKKTYILKYKLDGGELSRVEILRISHDAMGSNCATCLSKMSLSSSFLRITTNWIL